MKKVKVFTLSGANYGKTINFGKFTLTFNRIGEAEVENEEIAKGLAEKYPGWIVLDKKVDKPVVKDLSEAEAKLYQEDISKLQMKVSDRESKINALEEELKDWKAVVNKMQEEEKSGTSRGKEIIETQKKEIEELKLHVGLLQKTNKELIEVCVIMGVSEEKYKGKKNDELIQLILEESSK